jgi:hypothetical protein
MKFEFVEPVMGKMWDRVYEDSPFLKYIKENELTKVENVPSEYKFFEQRKTWTRTEIFFTEIPDKWEYIDNMGGYAVFKDPDSTKVWAIYPKETHFLAVLIGYSGGFE